MRVSLLQLRLDPEPPAERLARVLDLVAGEDADLVILPELWLSGAFDTPMALATAEPLDGPTFASLALGRYLHAGSLAEATDGRPYNTSVVVGPSGAAEAVYRKIHLFGFDGGEADAFSAGSEPVVWASPWGRLGLATCYDLRFPELFRALVDQGAEGFLIPTGWPAKRIARWDLLAQARAVENQAWVLGVNAVGTHAGVTMGGRSVVISPKGEVLARGSDDSEEILRVEVDLAAAAEWRSEFPALADRRL